MAVNFIFGRYIKYYVWHKFAFFAIEGRGWLPPYEYYARHKRRVCPRTARLRRFPPAIFGETLTNLPAYVTIEISK